MIRCTPLIPAKYNPETYLPFSIPGLGLLVMFVFLTFIGFVTANFFGRRIVALGEKIVSRMPVIRSIYSSLKQIFETLLNNSSQSFRQAVMIEYPRKGVWAVAFVTGDTGGEVARRIEGDELVNIYVPTTPNPTSGFMLVVPKSDLVFLDMSVEDALKMMISMGVITPDLEGAERELTSISADRRPRLRKLAAKRQAQHRAGGK